VLLDVKSYFPRDYLFLIVMQGVAYLTSMWYKDKVGAVREPPVRAGNQRLIISDMETTELKSAISELSARVVKIRDWL